MAAKYHDITLIVGDNGYAIMCRGESTSPVLKHYRVAKTPEELAEEFVAMLVEMKLEITNGPSNT